MQTSEQFSSLSPEDRARNLELFSTQEFDLVIVGGGIAGAGAARDAASRGLKVALVEAADFASGTSSRSSKLIHGGIRYLENLEFHLVFEALSERQLLFEMAPHLVHPLRFLLPIYKSGRVPAWKMGLGMWVYDALSLFEAPELNQFLNVAEIQQEFPQLQAADLSGAFAYYDAYMDDDRLVFETLRAAASLGATLANYVAAKDVVLEGGQVRALVVEDAHTKRTIQLKAKHFLSTVGPWTDRLGQKLCRPWKQTLRPTKGVHLTFSQKRFALKDAVVMGAESRIVFAIPRHEMVIVGTTDTDFPQDPSQVRTEREDVEYLLGVLDKYFPGLNIKQQDIIGCYAGVRPLVDDGAQTESKTSREHAIWRDPQGITFVAGGKYTTYRRMAEQSIDAVAAHMSLEERVRYGRSNTQVALNPLVTESLFERAQREHTRWADRWGLAPEITRQLALRHGLEAESLIVEALPLRERIVDAETWMWCAEALHAIEQTMCTSLTDFILRRTPLMLSRPDHGKKFVHAVAEVMGQRLSWNQGQVQQEINALQNQLNWELAAIFSS